MKVNDPVRRQRVLRLISDNALVTGRDFHNAALVLQHGTGFEDFRLAHELSMAAVALGDSAAAWLVSRTYDRMLLTLGHRQRFATQMREAGPSPTDTTAINDRVRAALGAAPVRAPK
jgi:hypothetical protein